MISIQIFCLKKAIYIIQKLKERKKYILFFNFNYIIIKISLVIFKVLIFFCKNLINLKCKSLIDIIIVDNLSSKYRFTNNYLLYSYNFNHKILIQFKITEITFVPSLNFVYKGSVWMERENWDLFGVLYLTTTDLRRMLTDYGITKHPLKKEFPLSGFTEIFYKPLEKNFQHNNILLTQKPKKI